MLRNSKSTHVSDFSNGLSKKFELTHGTCLEWIKQLCESTAYKIVFHNLSRSLWDRLYVGELSSSAIEQFLRDLEQNLMVIAETMNEKVRKRLVAEIMKASFEWFLLVLLAGGPSRAFTLQDSRQIKDDFKSLKDLFWATYIFDICFSLYFYQISFVVKMLFQVTASALLNLRQRNTHTSNPLPPYPKFRSSSSGIADVNTSSI
ncbi:mammalian uncoordinated homology 13 protein [Tanacetum coccineum]